MYSGVSELKLTQTDGPHIQVKGDGAWSMGMVNAQGEIQVGARDQCSDIRNGRLREARWEVVARVAYCFKRASISPRRVNRRNLSQFTSSVYFAGLLLPKFGGNYYELAWETLRV
jgi:hypothetical protein